MLALGRLLLGPHIPIAILGIRIAARFLKPMMFVRCVVDHEIDQDAQPTLVAAFRELDEIAESAIARIYPVVVRHIIAAIAAGRRLKWHEPDGGHAETLQVIELAQKTLKIADTISVRIRYVATDNE